jgi:hypothetical protein
MADAAVLKKGAMKLVAFVVVAVLGRYFLWPDDPVMEWLQDESDWKLKFAFVAWAVLTAAMAYDALVVLARGAIATPPDAKRRR